MGWLLRGYADSGVRRGAGRGRGVWGVRGGDGCGELSGLELAGREASDVREWGSEVRVVVMTVAKFREEEGMVVEPPLNSDKYSELCQTFERDRIQNFQNFRFPVCSQFPRKAGIPSAVSSLHIFSIKAKERVEHSSKYHIICSS